MSCGSTRQVRGADRGGGIHEDVVEPGKGLSRS